MLNLTTSLNKLLGRNGKPQNTAEIKDFREVVELVVEHSRGKKVEVDTNWITTLLRESEHSEADVIATAESLLNRIDLAPIAAQLEARREEAETKEQARIDFDKLFGQQQRDGREKLIQLEQEEARAIERSGEAIRAWSDLIAGGEITNEEREAIDKHSEVNAAIARLRDATNSGYHSTNNFGQSTSEGGDWAHIDTLPALLEKQTRRALADDDIGYSPERRAQLRSQLSAAERATKAAQLQLVKQEKEAALIIEKLKKLNAAKLLPESFAIVRHEPSRLDQQKRHAHEMGFHDGPTHTVTTGK